MIGRKNKGPSLAIAYAALGGTGDVFSSIGVPLGAITGYLAGSFEPLGGIISSLLTGVLGSGSTSLGSLIPSIAPGSIGYSLDMLSSSGVTSFPFTSLPSNLMSVFPSITSSIIPSL